MSIATRILSILVLLASIGAVVLAFMLFGAREEVVSGRESMAQAIADNSNKLGKTSTENPAKVKITPDEMSVANGNESVSGALKKFDDVTKAILVQRDMLADQLVELTAIVAEGEIGELKSEDLANVKTNPEKFGAIKKDAEETIQLYIKTREAYIDTIKILERALEMESVGSTALNPKSPELDKIKKALDDMDQKIRAMYGHITDINNIVPEEYRVKAEGMNGENYEAYLKDQKNNMEMLKARFDQLVKLVEELTAKVEELTAQVEKLEAERDKYKKDFEEARDARDSLQIEFDQLTEKYEKTKKEQDKFKQMGLGAEGTSGSAVAPQLPVETAALAAVEGKVVSVNEKSGFVVLNIGTSVKVEVKNKKIPLVLPKNAIMTVSTSLAPENAEFVCKVQVYKVEADRSMANILPGGKMPKVGDAVFFSDMDIANSTSKDAKK